MAKYADYVKNEDKIEQEIEESADASANREATESSGFVMPERFKGKSPEEIAKSYDELEKLMSRQAQDVGKYRKLTDDLLALESQKKQGAGSPQTKPVTVDDLYENADANIRRVVREETSDRVAELERQLADERQRQRLAEFTALHPGWKDQVKDPAFLNWIAESPYRVKLAQAADGGDLDAADVLFGLYTDLKGKQRETNARRQRRDKELADATLESSGPTASDQVDVYSRVDLLEKRIAANNGNQKAQRWLQANSKKIRAAYEEGRLVD